MRVNSGAKRIIFSVTNDLTTDQRVHRIISTLLKADVKPEVLLIGRKLKQSHALNHREYKTCRLRIICNKGFFFYAFFNLQLFFCLLFKKADILVANDLDTLPANFLVSKIKRIKLVYDTHELFTEVPELVDRKMVKRIWQFIEGKMLPKIKHSYTVCYSVAEYYNQKYPVNIQVVRNLPIKRSVASDTRLIEQFIPGYSGKKVIVYQGAVNKGRGLEHIIKAMRKLDGFALLIIGGGDIEVDLHMLVDQLNLEDKVYFTGPLPFEQLYRLTPHAHLGISLEENLGLNYYYSLPNKIFDYIQAHVPVLCSDFPEMKKIILEYEVGATIEHKEPEKLATLIHTIFENEAQYSKWKENTVHASEILCWENEEKRVEKVYGQVGISFP